MLKKLFQTFANTISELWYDIGDNEDDLVFYYVGRFLAMGFVFITICIGVLGIILVCLCLNHPIVFVFIGLPIFIIYFITKKLAKYGKDSKLNKEKQLDGGLHF